MSDGKVKRRSGERSERWSDERSDETTEETTEEKIEEKTEETIEEKIGEKTGETTDEKIDEMSDEMSEERTDEMVGEMSDERSILRRCAPLKIEGAWSEERSGTEERSEQAATTPGLLRLWRRCARRRAARLPARTSGRRRGRRLPVPSVRGPPPLPPPLASGDGAGASAVAPRQQPPLRRLPLSRPASRCGTSSMAGHGRRRGRRLETGRRSFHRGTGSPKERSPAERIPR